MAARRRSRPVDPTSPVKRPRFIGVYQQDRYSDGGRLRYACRTAEGRRVGRRLDHHLVLDDVGVDGATSEAARAPLPAQRLIVRGSLSKSRTSRVADGRQLLLQRPSITRTGVAKGTPSGRCSALASCTSSCRHIRTGPDQSPPGACRLAQLRYTDPRGRRSVDATCMPAPFGSARSSLARHPGVCRRYLFSPHDVLLSVALYGTAFRYATERRTGPTPSMSVPPGGIYPAPLKYVARRAGADFDRASNKHLGWLGASMTIQ